MTDQHPLTEESLTQFGTPIDEYLEQFGIPDDQQPKKTTINNLYIIEEVLSDYTYGMVVIAAPSLERCREIFAEEFDDSWSPQFETSRRCREYDLAIKHGHYEAIENVNRAEGVVSYVYGGG